jgi:hypothetical protein
VTGPSLVSCTAISAPNTPRRAPRRSQKRSYSGSACSGGAVAERLVHAALGVGEDAKRPDLVGEPVGLLLAVVVGDAQQHQQPGADL